jgi:hypothetical protein
MQQRIRVQRGMACLVRLISLSVYIYVAPVLRLIYVSLSPYLYGAPYLRVRRAFLKCSGSRYDRSLLLAYIPE